MNAPEGPFGGDAATDLAVAEMGRDYLDHLKKINDVFYDQIKIADQKAAYIFTFMLAFLITSSDGRAAFQMEGYSRTQMLLAVISATLAVAASISILAAILVVLPRRRVTTTSLFWGGWGKSRRELLAAGGRDDPGYVGREYLANIDNLSIIATAKYRWVSIAFQALTVMVLAYVIRLMLKV